MMVILVKFAHICFLLVNITLYITASQSSTVSKWKNNQRQIGNGEIIRHKRAPITKSDDLCPAHSPSDDKNITYECEEVENSQSCHKNGYLPRFTVARMQCKPNYSPLEGAYFRSICHEKSWIPEIDDCFKKCDKLNPINVDLKCYRRGKSIPCDSNALLAGTRVRPTCKKLHKYRDFIPTYREIVCQYDGKWDNMLFSCVPECGKPFKNATTLISLGSNATVGDSPWHVAIYNRNKILICGGTLIHPYLVLSAAHCFHTITDVRESADNFEIVVSKLSRNYQKKDNVNQKTFQIREIRYPTKGYAGLNNYFASDIAIIILKEQIVISPTVLPACIDWTGLNSNEYPPDDTPGKVVGWGLNENGIYSETLQAVNLPIINRERCLRTVPDDFKAYITYDKFCAGTENGPSVLQGDSGGGYLLLENGLYFLRGIVSLKQPTTTAIAAFTDLADHIDWILATRNAIEQEILTKETKIPQKQTPNEKVCNPYRGQLCTSFKDCPVGRKLVIERNAVLCGFDVDNGPKLCCPSNSTSNNVPVTSLRPTAIRPITLPPLTTTTPFTSPANKPMTDKPIIDGGSASGFEGGSEGELEIPEHLPSEPPSIDATLTNCDKYSINVTNDCTNATIPHKGTAKALPKEYPHMALIGYGNNFKDVEWLCAGSLISEKFVLSAALCKNKALGEPKWVMLGDLNITSTKDDARPTIYSIVKSHYSSPDFKVSTIYENLALYELNTTVVFSPYIRPACLHTTSSSPVEIGTKGVISGWGWGPTTTDTNDRSNEYLLKAALTVVEDKRCERVYDPNSATKLGKELKNGFQSKTMICAGNFTEGEALCADIDGSPLQIQLEYQPCMWKIFAVSSFGPTSCGNVAEQPVANPRIYVNIRYHLTWIEGIVWPDGF